MTLEIEQRLVRLEVEAQVIFEILNQAANLQKESNQTMTELTRRVNQLSDSVNYLTESLARQVNLREKFKSGNFSGKPHYHDHNGSSFKHGRTNDNLEMKEQLTSMLRKLDNLTQQFEVLQNREH